MPGVPVAVPNRNDYRSVHLPQVTDNALSTGGCVFTWLMLIVDVEDVIWRYNEMPVLRGIWGGGGGLHLFCPRR